MSLFSQNLEEKISNEICTCLGNVENLKDPEKKLEECVQKSFENNYNKIIKKFNDPQNTNTKDIQDYYVSIEGLLLSNCKSFLDYRKKNLSAKNKKVSLIVTILKQEFTIMKRCKKEKNRI
ncbi:hypothetical protein CLU97_3546 [Chryseobacterium sp. 7]|nr:hypothetical protein CLU97_3546 [Chryseobacterium sp. 7]